MLDARLRARHINTALLLHNRPYHDMETLLQNRLHTPRSVMSQLQEETQLFGHNGCVNGIEWSTNGRSVQSRPMSSRVHKS